MRLEYLRTLLAPVASRDFDVMQFDVTSAYLHGNLKDGYATLRKETWVLRLKKGLYGLVQAGRQDLKRGAERSHGGCWVHRDGKGPSSLRQKDLESGVFHCRGVGLTILLVLALGRSSLLCQRVWMRSTALLGWAT